jgi:WD domain, G-beta repeat
LISGICARDPRQLPLQLADRLGGHEAVVASGFVEKARQLISPPAIVPLRPCLTPPSAEIARLEGHTDVVACLSLLPDGRLASASDDKTIRLWDVATGAARARLEGHTGSVKALCLLPDGRLASASGDRTIRLWDIATGAETVRLEGHFAEVMVLCVLSNGRLASGSNDTTIRLWDGDRRRDRPPRGALRCRGCSMRAASSSACLRLSGRAHPLVGRGRRRDRPPQGPSRCCHCAEPTAGWGGSLQDPLTTRSDCGTSGPAPRPPALRGIRGRFRALSAQGRAARVGL